MRNKRVRKHPATVFLNLTASADTRDFRYILLFFSWVGKPSRRKNLPGRWNLMISIKNPGTSPLRLVPKNHYLKTHKIYNGTYKGRKTLKLTSKWTIFTKSQQLYTPGRNKSSTAVLVGTRLAYDLKWKTKGGKRLKEWTRCFISLII